VREFGFDPYRLTIGSDGNGANLLHFAVGIVLDRRAVAPRISLVLCYVSLVRQVIANDITMIDMLIDVVGMDIETGTRWGWTPLHVAASHNSLEAAKALVERGANTRAKSNASGAPARWSNKTPFQVSQLAGTAAVGRFLKTYNKSQLAAKPSTRK